MFDWTIAIWLVSFIVISYFVGTYVGFQAGLDWQKKGEEDV